MAKHQRDRVTGWQVMVPVVALLAGLVFAVSSSTADGADLRSERDEITELIAGRDDTIAELEAQRQVLAEDIEVLQESVASYDATVATAQDQADALTETAGIDPLVGPGVRVTLTDAPLGPGSELPPGARPDDVLIHQSDVQAVVNAMWAAGADAITIMGQRIITTSAVRCVGNTLLLEGKTYSPPFTIAAIGDQSKIRAELSAAPGVILLLEAVAAFEVGYDVADLDEVVAPEYTGSLGVTHATVTD